MRNFWTVRQEKTLALARALQCCAERLELPTGVLCNAAPELQRCMAPLMCLNGDEIVEASLLEPMGNEPRNSLTLEEEAALLGRNRGHWRLQKLLCPSRNVWKLLSPRNLPSRLAL